MKKYIDIAKEKITIEDIDEPYQDVAAIIGIENYVKLCEEMGGSYLCIPKIENLTRKYIYRKVLELKNTMPKKQLAKIFGLSLSTVYNIINKSGAKACGTESGAGN